MTATTGWTVTTAVEVGHAVVRGRVPMPSAESAGRLLYQLVAAGVVARVEPPTVIRFGCRRCDRPDELHCPDCRACWPGYACSLLCDLDDEHLDAAMERGEQWQELHEPAGAGGR